MNPIGRPRILWISSTSAKDHLYAAPSIMIAIALGVPPIERATGLWGKRA
jgi:hypothetical protein